MFFPKQTLGTGAVIDPRDDRDFLYADVFGAGEILSDLEWKAGFDSYNELGLSRIVQDQNGSSSCTGQATKAYMRRVLYKTVGLNPELSAAFIYSPVRLSSGGAYIRDVALRAADFGNVTEAKLPSYENGKPPSENYFVDVKLNDDVLTSAKNFDIFNARVIPGSTGNINLYAVAIKNHMGVIAGFTGDYDGWTRPCVRTPKSTNTWGHCVDLCAFGELEYAMGEFKAGTRCVFTMNSWGGRYTIQTGRWAGYQAIPESYFTASQPTAVGTVDGIYVFPSWVLVPDAELSPEVKYADFLKQNQGKLVQDSEQSGAFGLILDNKLITATPDRLPELLSTYLVRKEGMGIPKQIWNELPKKPI